MNSNPVLERAQHQEVSLSRQQGANRLQLAWFWDRLSDPALTGVGVVNASGGEFLPDYFSGTFTWAGPNLYTNGFRVVLERSLVPNLTATLDYSYGGALSLEESRAWPDVRSAIAPERRHAVGCKVAGRIPASHTRWIVSYKITSGGYALTAVDAFNNSTGQMDPYLNIFIRQPIPGASFIPGRMEALVDMRNLLAQGYLPIAADAGHPLYLVQSARAIRGGLAFTF